MPASRDVRRERGACPVTRFNSGAAGLGRMTTPSVVTARSAADTLHRVGGTAKSAVKAMRSSVGATKSSVGTTTSSDMMSGGHATARKRSASLLTRRTTVPVLPATPEKLCEAVQASRNMHHKHRFNAEAGTCNSRKTIEVVHKVTRTGPRTIGTGPQITWNAREPSAHAS